MPNNNPTGINQYTKGGGKGGKRMSGKVSSLQKARASVKKSIGIVEKKTGQNLSVLKQSMVRSATKFPGTRGKTVSNAYHIRKGNTK